MATMVLESAIAAFGAASSTLKTLRDAKGIIDEATLREKIFDLSEKLLEIQARYEEVDRERRRLADEIEDLKTSRDLDAKLERRGDTLWLAAQSGKREEGPFCMFCWDKERRLLRGMFNDSLLYCPNCKHNYKTNRSSE